MASTKRTQRAERKAQVRTTTRAGGGAADLPVQLLGDWQRRVVMMLLFSGIGFAAIAVFMVPSGEGYWLAVAATPFVGGLLGFILGGAPARALDARLVRREEPKPRTPLPRPATLPAPAGAALRTALLPPLLADLAGSAERLPPRERAAALALVEAGATAPEGEARQALARDLPRLILDLPRGGATTIDEAEALAKRLAQPAGRAS